MNEKIKQLCEQAKAYATESTKDFTGDEPVVWMDYYTEKFAELIIAECLDAVHSTYSDFGSAYPEKLAAGRGGLHYGYITIQNRFGLR